MGFDGNKFKVHLKLAINRLKMLQAKKQSLNEQSRREIAGLLERGKTESAIIRVEHIIREDYMLEALEMVELFCEILHARFGLLAGPEQKTTCPTDLQEQIATIIYAAPRCECEELVKLKQLLAPRVGKDFIRSAEDNEQGEVNPRVMQKLKIAIPSPVLANAYLAEIARTYKVKWVPPPPPPGNPSGGVRELATAPPAITHMSPQQQQISALEAPLLVSSTSTSTSPQPRSPTAVPSASSSPSAPPQFSTTPRNGDVSTDTASASSGADAKHQYFSNVDAMPSYLQISHTAPPPEDESDPSLDELQKRLDELKKRG